MAARRDRVIGASDAPVTSVTHATVIHGRQRSRGTGHDSEGWDLRWHSGGRAEIVPRRARDVECRPCSNDQGGQNERARAHPRVYRRQPRELVSDGHLEGDSNDVDPSDVFVGIYDSIGGPGTSPPRRTPVGDRPPRRDPVDPVDLRPNTRWSGSLVPHLPTYPNAGHASQFTSPRALRNSTPELGDANNYCVIGDQSMVAKWRSHCRRRIELANWYGMPVNLAFAYEAEQFDGGGTWKTWHNLSANGQTGGAATLVSAQCTACVGDTDWRLQRYVSGEGWTTIAETTIPEGFTVAITSHVAVNVADIWRPLVGHAFPIAYFEQVHKLVGADWRVTGDGGQHRYFVEFRVPNEELLYYTDPRTADQFDLAGLLPDYLGWVEPEPIPPDE